MAPHASCLLSLCWSVLATGVNRSSLSLADIYDRLAILTDKFVQPDEISLSVYTTVARIEQFIYPGILNH